MPIASMCGLKIVKFLDFATLVARQQGYIVSLYPFCGPEHVRWITPTTHGPGPQSRLFTYLRNLWLVVPPRLPPPPEELPLEEPPPPNLWLVVPPPEEERMRLRRDCSSRTRRCRSSSSCSLRRRSRSPRSITSFAASRSLCQYVNWSWRE
jgi:hypothetical protein